MSVDIPLDNGAVLFPSSESCFTKLNQITLDCKLKKLLINLKAQCYRLFLLQMICLNLSIFFPKLKREKQKESK